MQLTVPELELMTVILSPFSQAAQEIPYPYNHSHLTLCNTTVVMCMASAALDQSLANIAE